MTKLSYIHGIPDANSIDINSMVLDSTTGYFPINQTEGQFRSQLLLDRLDQFKQKGNPDKEFYKVENLIRSAVKDIHNVNFTGVLNDKQINHARFLDNLKHSQNRAIKRKFRLGNITELDVYSHDSVAKAQKSKKIQMGIKAVERAVKNFQYSTPNKNPFQQVLAHAIKFKDIDLNKPYFDYSKTNPYTINSLLWTKEAYDAFKMWGMFNSNKYKENAAHPLYVFLDNSYTDILTVKRQAHNLQVEKMAQLAGLNKQVLKDLHFNYIVSQNKEYAEPNQIIKGLLSEQYRKDIKNKPNIGIEPATTALIISLLTIALKAAPAIIAALRKDNVHNPDLLLKDYGLESNHPKNSDGFVQSSGGGGRPPLLGDSSLPLLLAGAGAFIFFKDK